MMRQPECDKSTSNGRKIVRGRALLDSETSIVLGDDGQVLARERQGMSVVLVGSFAPGVFSPGWLQSKSLITEAEAEGARVEVIIDELAAFTIGTLSFRVEVNRCTVSSSLATEFERLKDVVVNMFRLLRETPVGAMGVNRSFHFRSATEKEWHHLGDVLVPKTPWAACLEKPGLRSVCVEGKRPDDHKGYVRVQLEPSNKVTPGVFVNINDHFELNEDGQRMSVPDVMKLLDTIWGDSERRAEEICEAILAP